MILIEQVGNGDIVVSGVHDGLIQDVAIELAPALLAMSDEGGFYPYTAHLMPTNAETAMRRCVRMMFVEA